MPSPSSPYYFKIEQFPRNKTVTIEFEGTVFEVRREKNGKRGLHAHDYLVRPANGVYRETDTWLWQCPNLADMRSRMLRYLKENQSHD